MIRQDFLLLGAAMALLAVNWFGAVFTIRRLRARSDAAENHIGLPQWWRNSSATTAGMGFAILIIILGITAFSVRIVHVRDVIFK